MSANLDLDLMSCHNCANANEAGLEFFEKMQDIVYNNIMDLEILIEEHACGDEFICRYCGDIHLQILQQQLTLKDNIEYHNALTFLCELHKNNVYGLAPLEEEAEVPFVCSGCVDACPVHCTTWD
jgi:hypothetical protein